jgi:hypothetical protein
VLASDVVNPLSSEGLQERARLSVQWDIEADEVLLRCGVVQQMLGLGYGTYRFESNALKKNAIEVFTNQFGLTLQKRLDKLVAGILLKDTDLSPSFLEGLSMLAFAGARFDAERCLTGVCDALASRINMPELTKGQLSVLFSRLAAFVNKWQAHAEYKPFIAGFYEGMRSTPAGRSLLSVLLVHVCTPLQPHCLQDLKTLLGAADNDEMLVISTAPQFIALSFAEKFDVFTSAVMSWFEPGKDGAVNKSYAYAKVAVLMAFYNDRFSISEEDGMAFQVIRFLVQEDAEQRARSFGGFIALHSREIFNTVFSEVIKEQLEYSGLLPKTLEETRHKLLACVLVQCCFISERIISDDATVVISSDILFQWMMDGFVTTPAAEAAPLATALGKLAYEYNYRILDLGTTDEKERQDRKTLMQKRDLCRKFANAINIR